MAIQHQDGKQFTVDSLLKYFNSANDGGSVYTVSWVIMGHGGWEKEDTREELQKKERVMDGSEQTGSCRGKKYNKKERRDKIIC